MKDSVQLTCDRWITSTEWKLLHIHFFPFLFVIRFTIIAFLLRKFIFIQLRIHLYFHIILKTLVRLLHIFKNETQSVTIIKSTLFIYETTLWRTKYINKVRKVSTWLIWIYDTRTLAVVIQVLILHIFFYLRRARRKYMLPIKWRE